MKHLRRYIRNIIQEAFNTPNPGNIHDKLAFMIVGHTSGNGYSMEQAYTYVLFNTLQIQEGIAEAGMTQRRLREEEDTELPHGEALVMILRKGIVAMISVVDPPFECNGAMVVDSAAAETPLGPTMYDIAAMDPSSEGIFADRRSVRPKAQMVYQYYFDNRQDDLEEFYAMDDTDNPVTVSEDDDCMMSMLVDPSTTPYVELFFIASLDFLERKYPREYNVMAQKRGGLNASLTSTAHDLGHEYSKDYHDVNIAEYFIDALEEVMLEPITPGLHDKYADWAKEMVNVKGSLDAYVPSASDWFSDRAMNFTYKVKLQPEWTQMKQRGEKIRSDLMKMLPDITKEFFDETVRQRAKEFFNKKYRGGKYQ